MIDLTLVREVRSRRDQRMSDAAPPFPRGDDDVTHLHDPMRGQRIGAVIAQHCHSGGLSAVHGEHDAAVVARDRLDEARADVGDREWSDRTLRACPHVSQFSPQAHE